MLGLLALLAQAQAAGDDFWPQWRGPRGNGFAPKGNPPISWSESKNIRWKVEVPGFGSATPIVWGDRLFVLTAVEPEENATRGGRGMSVPAPTSPVRFEVLCLDRNTGRELWRRAAAEEIPHEGRHPTNTFASASAATDGRRLIAPFGSRGIFAYDLDGKPLWKVNLGRMKIKVGFGEGASPALHRDSVVVNWDHEGGSFIACLDATSGKEKWRRERDEGTTWVTPHITQHSGVTQVVVNGFRKTRSYDLADGRLLWECGGQAQNPIPTPVSQNGIVYCMTGFRGFAAYAIRLDSRGDVTDGPGVVWKKTDAAPYVASPLFYDDSLYFTKERQGILSCVNAATGQARFEEQRLPGIDVMYASPVGAAGRVYLTGRNGRTIVLKHGPRFEILAANDLAEGIDASGVLVDKCIYVRSARHLYCIAE